jgi:hypothetical protein
MRKKWLFFFIFVFYACFPNVVSAAPGLLQLATRAGFWCNDFPDTFMFLQNGYYYWADKYADNHGNDIDVDDTEVLFTLSRFMRPWHFGERNQWQYFLEGIFVYKDIHIKNSSADRSGAGDPILYQSIGWNNESKTTHLTFGLAAIFPLGDDELRGIGDDSIQIFPIIAWLERFGPIWLEGSAAYLHYFDDTTYHHTHGGDYYEYNAMLSYQMKRCNVYLQGDYKDKRKSKYQGVTQEDEGYNVTAAAGFGWFFTPSMELNIKYDVDVDGKNELQGQALNLRFMYLF